MTSSKSHPSGGHSGIYEFDAAPSISIAESKILVIDDEPINLKVASKYLNVAGYNNIMCLADSERAVAMVTLEEPDAVLLDIMMPHVSGLDILGALRADPRWEHLPVIILTASNDPATKRQALELGASEFLAKPVDPSELIPRMRNVLTVKRHHDHLRKYSRELEAAVLRRTVELTRSRQEVIHCLARAAEFRDDCTGRHVFRVGRYARLIAEEFGWRGERLNMFEQAAQLHDIGKIGVPDAILLKPGKLTSDEFEIMRKHSDYGRQITSSLPNNDANVLRDHAEIGGRLLEEAESPILAMAAVVALSHHERWDGGGYPRGLAGEAIPLEGRITSVADVFDALSSKRPYKEAFPLDESFRIVADGRGTQFDPSVVDAFVRRREAVLEIAAKYADGA